MAFQVLRATNDLLKEKAFTIRREVFVLEQKISEEDEFDEFDAISKHFVALDEHKNPIGAARWRITPMGVKLERFVVKKTARKQGLGQCLVKEVLSQIAEEVKQGTYMYLHAQLNAVNLYAKFGFKKKGKVFEECNTLHYTMWKVL